MNAISEKINALLWGGKPSEASRLLDEALGSVTRKISELEDELSLLRIEETELQAMRPAHITVLQDSPSQPAIDKAARNQAVLDIANEIASSSNGLVHTVQLVQRVRSAGIEMAVADNRIATATSNILLRTGRYTKEADGIYRQPRNSEGPNGVQPTEPSNSTASETGALFKGGHDG